MDLQDRQPASQPASQSMLCVPSDCEKTDGSRRVTLENGFPPELEWLPRREAPVVTRCRTLTALSTCLLEVFRLLFDLVETWKAHSLREREKFS